jgi:hypothetical protein
MNKQGEGITTNEQPTGRERNTKRSVLVTFAVLGGLVCLIGGTGLFAALQDSARSGPNSAESDAMAGSADIQVATATEVPNPVVGAPAEVGCGTFSEDLTTPFHTVTGVTPGFVSSAQLYCIKNVGSQQVTLSALSDELADVDYACTGDEALHGDTTCGSVTPSNGTGELSSVLRVNYVQLDCATNTATNIGQAGSTVKLRDNASAAAVGSLGTIAAGEKRCFRTTVEYPGEIPSVEVQRAQSDRATWRFKWVAQA